MCGFTHKLPQLLVAVINMTNFSANSGEQFLGFTAVQSVVLLETLTQLKGAHADIHWPAFCIAGVLGLIIT